MDYFTAWILRQDDHYTQKNAPKFMKAFFLITIT